MYNARCAFGDGIRVCDFGMTTPPRIAAESSLATRLNVIFNGINVHFERLWRETRTLSYVKRRCFSRQRLVSDFMPA